MWAVSGVRVAPRAPTLICQGRGVQVTPVRPPSNLRMAPWEGQRPPLPAGLCWEATSRGSQGRAQGRLGGRRHPSWAGGRGQGTSAKGTRCPPSQWAGARRTGWQGGREPAEGLARTSVAAPLGGLGPCSQGAQMCCGAWEGPARATRGGAGLHFAWFFALGGSGLSPSCASVRRPHGSLCSHKRHLVAPPFIGEDQGPLKWGARAPRLGTGQRGRDPGCRTLQEGLLLPQPPRPAPPGDALRRGTPPPPPPTRGGPTPGQVLSTRSLESQPTQTATFTPFTAEETETHRAVVRTARGWGEAPLRVCLRSRSPGGARARLSRAERDHTHG